jgi:hypothetical protein
VLVLIYSWFRCVNTLSRNDYSEKGYMRTANGSFILSQQIAYIHQGVAKQIYGRISVTQPISLMDTKNNIEYLFSVNEKIREKCTGISKSFHIPNEVRDFKYPENVEREAHFVLFDSEFKYMPQEIETECHKRNMKVPEPKTKELMIQLNNLRARKSLWGIVVASRFNINAQMFVSPYTGAPIDEVYPSLLNKKETESYNLECSLINWRNHFILTDEKQIRSWKPTHYSRRRTVPFTYQYKYWPGIPQSEEDSMYDNDGTCRAIAGKVRDGFGSFPLVCEEYGNDENILKELRTQTHKFEKIDSKNERNAYKTKCLAQSEVHRQRLKLILRDFSILVKQLGINQQFMQDLLDDHIPTKSFSVRVGYQKRSVWSVLKTVGKTGVFGLGGNIVTAFVDAREEKLQDAKIESLQEDMLNTRKLSESNAKKIAELKRQLREIVENFEKMIHFHEFRLNLTNTFALFESAIGYIDKEIDIFRNLIQQTVLGEVPEYMQMLTEELGIQKFLVNTFPTMANAQLAVEVGQPVIIADSKEPGEFILVMNYAVLSDEWDLYKLVPIPTFEGSYIRQRKIPFEYIALDYIHDQYVPIIKDVVKECKKGFCYIPGARQRVQSEECVVSPIVGDKPTNAPCTVDYFAKRNFFYPTQYGIIYSVEKPLTAHVICPDSRVRGSEKNLMFKGIGVLQIAPGCFVQTHEPDLLRFEALPTTRFVNISTTLSMTSIVNTPLQLLADYEMPVAPKLNTTDVEVELTGYVTRLLNVNRGFFRNILYAVLISSFVFLCILGVIIVRIYRFAGFVEKLKSTLKEQLTFYIDSLIADRERAQEEFRSKKKKENVVVSTASQTVPLQRKQIALNKPLSETYKNFASFSDEIENEQYGELFVKSESAKVTEQAIKSLESLHDIPREELYGSLEHVKLAPVKVEEPEEFTYEIPRVLAGKGYLPLPAEEAKKQESSAQDVQSAELLKKVFDTLKRVKSRQKEEPEMGMKELTELTGTKPKPPPRIRSKPAETKGKTSQTSDD